MENSPQYKGIPLLNGIFFHHHLPRRPDDGITGKRFIGFQPLAVEDLIRGGDLNPPVGIDPPAVLIPEKMFGVQLLVLDLVPDHDIPFGLHDPPGFQSFAVIGFNGGFHAKCRVIDLQPESFWKFEIGLASLKTVQQDAV